jgi:hypothetical protein
VKLKHSASLIFELLSSFYKESPSAKRGSKAIKQEINMDEQDIQDDDKKTWNASDRIPILCILFIHVHYLLYGCGSDKL